MSKADRNRKKKAHRRRVQQHTTTVRRQTLPRRDLDVGPKQEMLSHRASRIAEIIVAYPNQIAKGLAEREEAGWIFGRLYLVGVIDRDQKVAAERLIWAVSTYRRMLNKYYGVKAADLDLAFMRGDGPPSEDLSDQMEKKFSKIKAEYDTKMNLLLSCGETTARAVLDAWEFDSLTNLAMLRQGLDTLCGRRNVEAEQGNSGNP